MAVDLTLSVVLIVLHVLALAGIAALAVEDERHAARTARPGHRPAWTVHIKA
ncbi:hypothetical protein [Kitasatospora cineracea]|uniref:hypothetical protein n=1 Tax=Kitasatospora cineracea TaxID=88074 RepID=UPI0036757CF1